MAEIAAKILPARIGYRLVRLLSGVFYHVDGAGRRGIEANLHQIYSYRGITLGSKAMDRSVRCVFDNFGAYLFEFFRYQRAMTEAELEGRFLIEGMQYLEEAVREGHGALLLTGHLGNWEMGAALLSGKGYPLHVVALPMPDPKVNALFMARRRTRWMEIVENGSAAKSCIRQLRKNQVVAVLGDRDFSSSTETTPFFGRPARIPKGPVRMAILAGSPIIPGFLTRLPGGRFHFRLLPPIGPLDRKADMAETMLLIAQKMEVGIAFAPEQWFIFHSFWDVEQDLERCMDLVNP